MFFDRFRRRSRKKAAPGASRRRGPQREVFPGLDDERGLELRKQLRHHFAEHGAAIHFDGMHGMVNHPSRGRIRVGFENLVRMITGNEHPNAVASHAEAFVQAIMADEGTETLRAPDIYAGLRLKLTPTWGLDEEERRIIDAATIDPFTDDVAVALVLDTESAIQTVALDRIQEFDDVTSLRRAATANLRSELSAADIEIVYHEANAQAPGGHFWSFESDSFYLGSAPLLLEEVLGEWVPQLDQSNGVIFAMPNRHLMLAREVSTGSDLLQGLQRLAMIAARFGLERSHPISPAVHLSYAGGLATISEIDRSAKELKIIPDAHLVHQLGMENP